MKNTIITACVVVVLCGVAFAADWATVGEVGVHVLNKQEVAERLALLDSLIAAEADTNAKLDLINRKLNINYKLLELGGVPSHRPLKSGALPGDPEIPVEADIEAFILGVTK